MTSGFPMKTLLQPFFQKGGKITKFASENNAGWIEWQKDKVESIKKKKKKRYKKDKMSQKSEGKKNLKTYQK